MSRPTTPAVTKRKVPKSLERPDHDHDTPDGSDPHRYHLKLLASSNAKGHRQCTACHDFGGQRARMACFCRGRARPFLCTFLQHQNFGTPDLEGGTARHRGSVPPAISSTLPSTSCAPSENLRTLAASMQESPPNIASIDLDLDPYYYLPTLFHEADGSTPRSCSACQEATLERAQYAIYCKGRSFRGFCKFGHAAAVIPSPPGAEGIQTVSAIESPPDARGLAAIDKIVLETTRVSSLTRGRSRSVRRELSEYLGTVRQLPGAQAPMYCRPCRAAGDSRAGYAIYCRGRTWTRLCPFVDKAVLGGTNTGGTPIPTLAKPPEDPSDSRLLPDDIEAITDSLNHAGRTDIPAHLQRLRYSKNGAFQLVCKICKVAGGIRTEKAVYCQGRQASKHCIFLERNRIVSTVRPSVRSSDAQNVQSAVLPAVEVNSSVSLPRRVEGLAFDPQPPTPITEDETPRPVVPSSAGRAKRKRTIITPQPPSPIANTPLFEPEIVSLGDLFGSAPPRPSSRNIRSSTNVSQSTVKTLAMRNDASRSADRSSLPPSSPPFMASPSADEQEASPITSYSLAAVSARSGQFRRHPTPQASAVFRNPPLSACPTPSPSLGGMQSSSPCSDHVVLTLPPRKSALKQRLSDTTSPVSSVKRLRFSLQPQSPPSNSTRSPDLRFSGMGHTTSPASSLPDSSPAFRQSISSSPFPNTIHVRAADADFQLRSEHTGRVSQHMLAALAPSLEGSRATLGSSTSRSFAEYALPTPPLSHGSTTSTSSRSQPPESSPSRRMGLMLPPPVPIKRQSLVRPLTPVSPPKDEHEARPSSILMVTKSAPAMRAKARSRSRSVSVAPSSVPNPARAYEPSTPFRPGGQRHRQVSTTPSRKKSRSERELARVARDIGDDAGLEWGMDEEIGVDLGRLWREGSVVQYL